MPGLTPPNGPATAEAEPTPIKVLCVDDQGSNPSVPRRILTAAGFQIVDAASVAALRLAASVRPSLVVLDARSLDRNTFDVCRLLKSDPLTRAIPILRISSSGMVEDALPDAQEHQPDLCLHEPLDSKTLVAAVKMLVRACEAERRQEAAEARARAARQHALHLVESLADAVVAFDVDWRCTGLSRPAAELFEATPDEAIGAPVWQLFPAATRISVEDACRRAWLEMRPVTVEHYFAQQGRWFESYINPFDGGACAHWRDVTQRKRAEESLLRSESQQRWERHFLESLLANVPFAVAVLQGPELRYTLVNPRYQAMAGAAVPVVARTFRDVVPFSGDADAETRLRRVLETGDPWHISEYAAPIPGKPEARWEGEAVRLPHAPGEDRSILLLLSDVTDRVLVQERLQRAGEEAEEARQRLKAALESITDGLVVLDRDWRFTYCSAQAERLTGVRSEDILGGCIWDVFPHAAGTRFQQEYLRAARTGQPVHFEEYYPAPLNQWIECHGYPSPDGLTVYFRDVTERKRAEEALRESEARYRSLFESMQEGYVVGEPMLDEAGEPVDWRYLDVNPAMLAMLRRTREQVIGHTYRELYPNADWRFWVRGFGQVALTGKPARLEGYGDGTKLHYVAIVHSPSPGKFAAILRDVTDAKKAEEAARKDREWLRVTLSSIGDAVVATDAEGRVMFLNGAAASLTGWSEGDAIGRPAGDVFRVIHEDTGAPVEDVVSRVLAEGRVIPLANHTALVRRDGRIVPVEDSAAPIRTDAGAVLGVVVVFHDVTLERRAEQVLRESEAQFRTLANAIPQLCWMANADGWIFWYNDRWYDYTGTTARDMEGWGWQSVHDPVTLPGVLERWRASIATGMPFDMVFPLRGADGVFRPFLTRIVPIRDGSGSVVRWFGTNTDISEQRRTEEALRASDARETARAAELKALLDATPAAIFIAHDRDCRTIIGSRVTYEMLRVPEGVNLSPASTTLLAADFRFVRNGTDIAEPDLPLQTAATTGRAVRNYEFELVYGDGARRHMLGDAVPLVDNAGRPRGAVGAFLDVTESKRNEERLRQAQKLESVGLLAGGIAHDFNNLLTGILGNATMLETEVPSQAAERLAEIVKSAQHAAELTRQLLAYSGKGQFIVREIDVSRMVNEISALVEFSIPRSAQLAVSAERRVPHVRMDPSQLQQILMNLVINAGEAIGEGNPGRITLATSLADVDEAFVDALGGTVAPGRYVRIEVSDTGPGIDEATKPRIFDPFFTTKFTGRGLGLAAVSGILRALGAAVTVESSPGNGATFQVLLPAAEERAPAAVPAAGGAATILVVDDEPTVREFIAAVLRKRGYRVLLAADGRDALSVVRREPAGIDAIVLDVVMPVMGAREALPELKRELPGAKVLLTSGYSEAEARRLCAEYPGAAFLQKPYTARRFLGMIENLIGGRSAAGI